MADYILKQNYRKLSFEQLGFNYCPNAKAAYRRQQIFSLSRYKVFSENNCTILEIKVLSPACMILT